MQTKKKGENLHVIYHIHHTYPSSHSVLWGISPSFYPAVEPGRVLWSPYLSRRFPSL